MKSQKFLLIPKGSSKAIISHLESNGYAVSIIDVFLLRLFGFPQSGFVEIPSRFLKECNENSCIIKRADFLASLVSAKAATKSITLIPGETSYFLLQDIARIFNLDKEKLQALYEKHSPYQDGVIFADTYSLPYHANEEMIIKYLIESSLARHRKLSNELLGFYDERTWFQYVAKASIIQKEAANIAEMPIVSSVIDNRIKNNMPLQMDGSLNYGKYSHTRITPDRIRNDTSQFNTYKYKGIPKEPSGSVSIDSIKAAIYPAKTEYLYFMRNKNGVHDFAKSYDEHLKNINRVKN